MPVVSKAEPCSKATLHEINRVVTMTKEQWLRLFVDGYFYVYEGGWEAYENRQLGCLLKMAQALSEGCRWLMKYDTPVFDLSILSELHRMATPENDEHGKAVYPDKLACEVSSPDMCLGFNLIWKYGRELFTLKGLEEALEYRKQHQEYVDYPVNMVSTFVYLIRDGEAVNLELDTVRQLFFDCDGRDETTPSRTPEDWFNVLKKRLLYVLSALGSQESLNSDSSDAFYHDKLWSIYNDMNSVPDVEKFNWNTLPVHCHRAVMAGLLKKFSDDLVAAVSEDEILDVISIYIPQFNQVHPFKDGNGRTFQLLTNLALLSKGLPVMMMQFPSDLNLFDKDCLKRSLKRGMEETLKVCLEPGVFSSGQYLQLFESKCREIETLTKEPFEDKRRDINSPARARSRAERRCIIL